MKNLRKIHLYLGCFFAPVLIYFSVSGAWQLYRFNNLPKESEPTTLQKILHALSSPHTHSTYPGFDPKVDHSALFNVFSLAMALGIAPKDSRKVTWVYACLVAGVVIPIACLWLKV